MKLEAYRPRFNCDDSKHIAIKGGKDVAFNIAPEIADIIVRCVNTHDALTTSLIEILALAEVPYGNLLPEVNEAFARARAALALATASETRTEGTPDAKQGTQGKDGN